MSGDKQVRGPIGSACIFRHVLDAQRAQGYGVRLGGLIKDLPYYRQHRQWLQDAQLDYDTYLRRASLAYLTDARLRTQAQLTRTQEQALTQCRAAGHPLAPEMYAALLQRGERVTPPPEVIPIEADEPLNASLREHSRLHLEAVLAELPRVTRSFLVKAIADENILVAPYLRRALEEAVQKLQQRQVLREREEAQRSRTVTGAVVKLSAPVKVISQQWSKLESHLPADAISRIRPFLLQRGIPTLHNDDRLLLNAALQTVYQEQQRRWIGLAQSVSPVKQSPVPHELLRAGLQNTYPLIAEEMDQGRPIRESQVTAARHLAERLANPQPNVDLRTLEVFLTLMQALAAQYQLNTAVSTLRKVRHRTSWISALIGPFTLFLQGQAFSASETVNVLRRHRSTREERDIEIPSPFREEAQRRWNDIAPSLSRGTRDAIQPALLQGTVPLPTFVELVHAIAGRPPARPESPSTATSAPPPLKRNLQSIPENIQTFVRANQENVEAQLGQKWWPTVEQALQDGTPVPMGVLQLLLIAVKDEMGKGK